MKSHGYAEVNINDLTFDLRVQRVEGLVEGHVLQMAENFNPAALGTITVSSRGDGTMVILDGRHRVEAARLADYKGLMPAMVYYGLTLEEEAEMFLKLNDFKTPSTIAKFLVRVTQGDPEAVEINRILEDAGWKVMPGGMRGYFAAVASIQRVYRGLRPLAKGRHPEQVERTIFIITSAWGHSVSGVHQTIVMGIGAILARYGDDLDGARLSMELSKFRPHVLVGDAQTLKKLQGGQVSAAMARVMVGHYNRRLRENRLPDWDWTTV